jgi:hypothetical protein
MEEHWRVVNNYPNYSISSLGQVKNNKNNQLKQSFSNTRGYLTVDLYKNNICKHFSIHRLVGIHFLPNWNNYKEIDHRNRNSLDNRLINLRWCSRSDNLRNREKMTGCSSKYKGVSFDKSRNKWTAEIWCKELFKRKKKFLGRFNTEEEAYNAWKKFVLDNNLEKFYEDKI